MRSGRSAEAHDARWLWTMVCILLLGYVLRVVGLMSESLWIDESYSLALASHNLRDIVTGAAADQHPPLYYLLLHLWLSPGQSVFHLRYLSVLVGMLGVAAGASMGRRLLGPKAGMVAALLLACSPMHIWYSQEARMYILLALLTTVSAYTVWRLMRGLGGWMLYGLSTLLALYTHYLAGCVVLVENLIVLGWGLKRRQSLFRAQWLGTQVALVTLFAPWLPVALYQARFHRMTWARPPTAEIVRDALILMALGDSGVRGGEALSVAGLGSALLAVVWLVWRAHRAGRAGAYGFLLLWLGLPFGMMVAASQVYPLFHAKQLLMLLVPLLLLVAGALTELPWVPRWMLAGVLAFFVIGSLGDLYGSDTKHGWRETAGHIEMHYQPGDLLYLNPAAGMLALKPYLHRALPYDGYPPEYDVVRGGWQGEQVTASIAAHAMAALPDTYRRVWLIEFGPTFWDPEGHLAAWLELHGQLVGEWSFQGVRARLYGLAPGSGP